VKRGAQNLASSPATQQRYAARDLILKTEGETLKQSFELGVVKVQFTTHSIRNRAAIISSFLFLI
jgi:hypothetical protein